MKNTLTKRWLMLAIAVVSMLFAGIIYAWSILKIPFSSAEFSWAPNLLALNFTFTMSFFCIGGFLGSKLTRKFGVRPTLIAAGLLAGIGFVLTGQISNASILFLYATYSLMAGLGIGIAYNVVISTVNAWFPDKKGLCSGSLMMGFGASSLLLGNLASQLFNSLGWRTTYVLLGIALSAVLLATAFVIALPDADVQFPAPKATSNAKEENFERKDYTTSEMIRRFSFWRVFLYLIFITAVGNSVISFARDLALSVGAGASLATTLVGVLAVCNGLGRILTGIIFDKFGRRFTMFASNIVTIIAASITLLAVGIHSVPLCVIGLCITGISYGASPTMAATITSAFYGQKHFASNFSVANFNLMFASFIATACSGLLTASGSFVAPFVLLLSLSVVALGLNISIRKP